MGKTTGPGQSFLFYNNLTVEKLFCRVWFIRSLYRVGRDGQLPHFLGMLHWKRKTPLIPIILNVSFFLDNAC